MTGSAVSITIDFGAGRIGLDCGGAYYRPIYSGCGVYHEVSRTQVRLTSPDRNGLEPIG
jgi:hypothetical protein